MKCISLVTTALTLVLAYGLACAADVPRVIDEDGPAHDREIMNLRELWRIGGEDSDVMFGRIADLKMHSDGCLYVLDNQLCRVMVISEDGEHLRDISREGDGPGELRQPTGLVFLNDDTLGVGIGFPGKLVILGLDGTPIDTCYPVGAPAEGNVAVMLSLHCVDGLLVASGASVVFADEGKSHSERFLSVGGASLGEFHRVLETTTPLDPTGFYFVEINNYYIDTSWVLGSGGRIYAPMRRDAYEISEFDTEGNCARVFGRRYEPRKRTTAEKSRIVPLINPGVPANTDWNISDHDPCVWRIMINPDDETVWVLTTRGHEDQPEHILETWDVFAPRGEFLKQVSIPLGNEMIEGTCYLVGGGRMVVVRGEGTASATLSDAAPIEAEPLEVICYELR